MVDTATKKIFAVVGANGGTGREIVKRLLETKDFCNEDTVQEVRAIVRDPSKIKTGADSDEGSPFSSSDQRLKIVAGDCSKPETLKASFQDCYAVFYAAAGKGYDACIAVDRDGLKEAARIAKEANVKRFVLVSAQFVDPINKSGPNKTIRGFLNTINTGMFHYEGMMDFKFQGENFLKESNQTYTIVRPGRLADGGGELGASGKLMVGQTNGALGKSPSTTRADVARVCVAAVFSPNAENVTFELGSDNTMPTQATTEELAELFQELKKDE